MKVRFHRGSLAESLSTLIQVTNRTQLFDAVRSEMDMELRNLKYEGLIEPLIKVELYHEDDKRIDWKKTYSITLSNCAGVVGFCDQPLESLPVGRLPEKLPTPGMRLRMKPKTQLEKVQTIEGITTTDELYVAVAKAMDWTAHQAKERVAPMQLPTHYVDPILSFGFEYAIYHCGHIIGFTDLPFSYLTDSNIEPQLVPGPFYIDKARTEHGCCWSSMILQKSEDEDDDPHPFTECNSRNAVFICNALNEAWNVAHPDQQHIDHRRTE